MTEARRGPGRPRRVAPAAVDEPPVEEAPESVEGEPVAEGAETTPDTEGDAEPDSDAPDGDIPTPVALEHCRECVPPGGLHPEATAFACEHGSYTL